MARHSEYQRKLERIQARCDALALYPWSGRAEATQSSATVAAQERLKSLLYVYRLKEFSVVSNNFLFYLLVIRNA